MGGASLKKYLVFCHYENIDQRQKNGLHLAYYCWLVLMLSY